MIELTVAGQPLPDRIAKLRTFEETIAAEADDPDWLVPYRAKEGMTEARRRHARALNWLTLGLVFVTAVIAVFAGVQVAVMMGWLGQR